MRVALPPSAISCRPSVQPAITPLSLQRSSGCQSAQARLTVAALLAAAAAAAGWLAGLGSHGKEMGVPRAMEESKTVPSMSLPS